MLHYRRTDSDDYDDHDYDDGDNGGETEAEHSDSEPDGWGSFQELVDGLGSDDFDEPADLDGSVDSRYASRDIDHGDNRDSGDDGGGGDADGGDDAGQEHATAGDYPGAVFARNTLPMVWDRPPRPVQPSLAYTARDAARHDSTPFSSLLAGPARGELGTQAEPSLGPPWRAATHQPTSMLALPLATPDFFDPEIGDDDDDERPHSAGERDGAALYGASRRATPRAPSSPELGQHKEAKVGSPTNGPARLWPSRRRGAGAGGGALGNARSGSSSSSSSVDQEDDGKDQEEEEDEEEEEEGDPYEGFLEDEIEQAEARLQEEQDDRQHAQYAAGAEAGDHGVVFQAGSHGGDVNYGSRGGQRASTTSARQRGANNTGSNRATALPRRKTPVVADGAVGIDAELERALAIDELVMDWMGVLAEDRSGRVAPRERVGTIPRHEESEAETARQPPPLPARQRRPAAAGHNATAAPTTRRPGPAVADQARHAPARGPTVCGNSQASVPRGRQFASPDPGSAAPREHKPPRRQGEAACGQSVSRAMHSPTQPKTVAPVASLARPHGLGSPGLQQQHPQPEPGACGMATPLSCPRPVQPRTETPCGERPTTAPCLPAVVVQPETQCGATIVSAPAGCKLVNAQSNTPDAAAADSPAELAPQQDRLAADLVGSLAGRAPTAVPAPPQPTQPCAPATPESLVAASGSPCTTETSSTKPDKQRSAGSDTRTPPLVDGVGPQAFSPDPTREPEAWWDVGVQCAATWLRHTTIERLAASAEAALRHHGVACFAWPPYEGRAARDAAARTLASMLRDTTQIDPATNQPKARGIGPAREASARELAALASAAERVASECDRWAARAGEAERHAIAEALHTVARSVRDRLAAHGECLAALTAQRQATRLHTVTHLRAVVVMYRWVAGCAVRRAAECAAVYAAEVQRIQTDCEGRAAELARRRLALREAWQRVRAAFGSASAWDARQTGSDFGADRATSLVAGVQALAAANVEGETTPSDGGCSWALDRAAADAVDAMLTDMATDVTAPEASGGERGSEPALASRHARDIECVRLLKAYVRHLRHMAAARVVDEASRSLAPAAPSGVLPVVDQVVPPHAMPAAPSVMAAARAEPDGGRLAKAWEDLAAEKATAAPNAGAQATDKAARLRLAQVMEQLDRERALMASFATRNPESWPAALPSRIVKLESERDHLCAALAPGGAVRPGEIPQPSLDPWRKPIGAWPDEAAPRPGSAETLAPAPAGGPWEAALDDIEQQLDVCEQDWARLYGRRCRRRAALDQKTATALSRVVRESCRCREEHLGRLVRLRDRRLDLAQRERDAALRQAASLTAIAEERINAAERQLVHWAPQQAAVAGSRLVREFRAVDAMLERAAAHAYRVGEFGRAHIDMVSVWRIANGERLGRNQ